MQEEPYVTVSQTTKTWGYRVPPGNPELLQGLYQPSPFFCPSHPQLPAANQPFPVLPWETHEEGKKKGKNVSLHLAYFQTQLCYFHARITQVRENFESLSYKVRTLNSQETADLCALTTMTDLKYHHENPTYFKGKFPAMEVLLTASTFPKGSISCKTFQTSSLLKLKTPYSLDATHQLQEEVGLLPGLCQH